MKINLSSQKRKIYSHRDFYKLSMEYLEFANENISKNEKDLFHF